MSRISSLLVCASCLLLGCSRAPDPEPHQAEKASPAMTEARTLTEQGYELKREGANGAALELFRRALSKLVDTDPGPSPAQASILDDQATIHLRTGDFAKARSLYQQALQILAKTSDGDPRLAAGIGRRLATLDALEAKGLRCSEPLVPEPPGDAGDWALPYFPELGAVHKVFGELSPKLAGCVEGTTPPATMRLVLTGQGLLIAADLRGKLANTPEGACLKKKLLEAAPGFKERFPRFRACFRNFTYPFVLNE